MGKFNKLIYLTGAYKVFAPLYSYLLYEYNRREETDLQTYNQDQASWAIVTGASEGIGKEFALQLAKHKFNIAISSRSEEKLSLVERDIMTINPSAQVYKLALDYSTLPSAVYPDHILQNLRLVVNNVGALSTKAFFAEDPQKLQNLMHVNHGAIVLNTAMALR